MIGTLLVALAVTGVILILWGVLRALRWAVLMSAALLLTLLLWLIKGLAWLIGLPGAVADDKA